MAETTSKLGRFFSELWRRHVPQIAIPYGVFGWLVVQVSELVLDVYDAPPWIMQTLLVVIVAGFPVAILLAWLFDFSPRGGLVYTRSLNVPAAEPDLESETAGALEFQPVSALALEMGDAERRQVTVLRARLHPLAGTVALDDPEFLREAAGSIERIFSDLAGRFGAHRLPGSPLELVLVFGYPTTSQGEARAAIAAGLTLVAEMRKAPELDNTIGSTAFDACIGVATGMVVVEDAANDQVSFIGLAPRVAAWLEGLAEPGSLLIESQTRQLVGDHYLVESQGVFEEAQFGGQSEVFAVIESVSDDLRAADLLPLIGRDEELAQLQECWAGVSDGEGRYVVLRGEGGLGKSSLLRAFVRQVYDAREPVYLAQCVQQNRHTPFAPVITILDKQVLHFAEEDDQPTRRARLVKFVTALGADSSFAVPLLSRLLSLEPDPDEDFAGESAQSLRARTIDLVIDLLNRIADQHPLLMVLEDLLWADPSTLELIGQIMNRGPIPGLFLLFSTRPEFEAEWLHRSFVTIIDMKPLNRRKALALIEQTAAGTKLPERLCERIIEETGGVPMYVQELTRAVIESGRWQTSLAEGGEIELSRLSIPANLQESIAARIDNLGTAKAVLQLCSVLGREFSFELLRDVSATEHEQALRDELARIVDAELLFQRGMANRRTYLFKHVFIQEAAYNTLLRKQRRQLHERTAQALEARASDPTKRQPELLAHHYTEAGNVEKAIENWMLASSESLAAFANAEAAEQARRGIAMLEAQPANPARAALIIPLQTMLGTALLATYGYAHPEVRTAFTKALTLCEEIGDSPELFRVLVGVWMYYFVAGDYREALALGERMLSIAETGGNPAQHLQARYCVGLVRFYLGEFALADQHFQAAVDGEREDVDYASQSPTGDDNRIHNRSELGLTSWQLGRPRLALRWAGEARELARGRQHPLGVLFANFLGSWLHQMRNDPQQVLAWAGEGASIAREKGFPFWEALCGYMLSWAQGSSAGWAAGQTDCETALETMRFCLEQYLLSGSRAGITWLMVRFAEACLQMGRLDQAEAQLASARGVVAATGERAFEPEILRLSGQLCRMRSLTGGTEQLAAEGNELFERAFDMAQALGARAQALRAALDLVDAHAGGKRQAQSLQRLRDILGEFEETDDSWYFGAATERLKPS